MSKILECGCVPGYFWCAKHDICTRRAGSPTYLEFVGPYDGEPLDRGCTCFISAPCGFCTSGTNESPDTEGVI